MRRGSGSFDEGDTQPGIAWPDMAAPALASALVVGWTHARPGCQVRPGRKAADLPGAAREAQFLAKLLPHTTILSGAHATPARTRARSVDAARCSAWSNISVGPRGIQLSAAQDGSGRLSVAQVLRDAELCRTGLVVLAACTTGQSLIPVDTVQEYAAMDDDARARVRASNRSSSGRS